MSSSLRNKASTGVIWSAIDRFSSQGIQFLVMLIMARLLTPKDYGIVGMLSVFIAISTVIVDSGFGKALIRKKDLKDEDNSTVFFSNLIIAILLYSALFFCAPYIAKFYNTTELVSVTRVLCLLIVFNSLAIVPKAIFTRSLDFKTQAKASLLSAIISGTIGVTMALKGFSYWALVFQLLSNSVISAVLIWVLSRWKPRLFFSRESFRNLFSFGSKLMFASITDRIYQNIYPIVIGKVFSAEVLGYYSRAHNFSDFPSSNFTGIIQHVSYPTMCSLQDDDILLKSVSKKFLKLSAYVIFPIMIGMVCLAYPMVVVIIGKQWAFTSELLQIISFQMIWYPINAINVNILQAKGRSDYYLYAEIVKKTLSLLIVLGTIPFGIKIMCFGAVAASILEMFINTYLTRKVLNYGLMEQLKDLFPIILLTMTMAISLVVINIIVSSIYLRLIIGVSVGVAVYLGISFLLHYEEMADIKKIIFKQ